MAEIRRLDGSTIDTAKLGRNERIAVLLAEIAGENDAGRISAIVTVLMMPDGAHRVNWELPDHDFGYSWGLALRGALMAAQHTMGNAEITVPPKPKPKPDLPDGA